MPMRELTAKPELLAKSDHADILATDAQRTRRQPKHHLEKRGFGAEGRD
jgi:hypothetical protein